MVGLVSLLGTLSFLKYLYLQERKIWQSRAGESYLLEKNNIVSYLSPELGPVAPGKPPGHSGRHPPAVGRLFWSHFGFR